MDQAEGRVVTVIARLPDTEVARTLLEIGPGNTFVSTT
jgi:hypothetical protein